MRNPDYVERVNRAIDHIVRQLDRPLGLDELAGVACFSKCHFHRVFQAVVGETLGQFVKRLRLERAVFLMAHGGGAPLTEIALRCGFASSSDFSRAFKQRYGVPPSLFDLKTYRGAHRKELEQLGIPQEQRHRLRRLTPGENPDGFQAVLRDLPARRVAYIRVLEPYEGSRVMDAAARLVDWAEARGLGDNPWLGYSWDDPEVVALEDCRYDVGVVAEGVDADGEVGVIDFAPMRVAEIEVRGGIDLELRALDWLFGTWLPSSGYVPTEHPAFEAWIGRPFAHGTEHFELHVQLPVERL